MVDTRIWECERVPTAHAHTPKPVLSPMKDPAPFHGKSWRTLLLCNLNVIVMRIFMAYNFKRVDDEHETG